VVRILVVSIPLANSILVATPAVSTPLSDARHRMAPAVECSTRNVNLLVRWTDLLICHHDLWLPWVRLMGPMVVVAHGGEEDGMQVEEEAMDRAGEEPCHIHSHLHPIFWICAFSVLSAA